jgi:FkbM family methyltransferase
MDIKMREIIKRLFLRNPRIFKSLKLISTIGSYYARIPYHDDYHVFAGLGKGVILDLGANTGQSALTLSLLNPEATIISFEPNPACEFELSVVKKILGHKFEYKMAAVGEKHDNLTLYIPVKKSVELTQEATFIKDELFKPLAQSRFGTPDHIKEVSVPVIKLDNLSLKPIGVKIDIQGFELEALLGLEQTIATYRPVVVIESQAEMADIFNYFNKISYEWFTYIEGKYCDYALGLKDNVIFLPKESSIRKQ